MDTRRKEQFSPLVPYSFSPSLLFCWTRNAFYVVLSSLRSLSSKQTCPLPRVQEPEAARLSCLANVLVRIFWLLVIETQVNLFEAKEIHWLMRPARWGCGSVSQVWVSWSFLPLASLAVHRLAFTDRLALAVAGLQVPPPPASPPHPTFAIPRSASLRRCHHFQVLSWVKLCSLWSGDHSLFISCARHVPSLKQGWDVDCCVDWYQESNLGGHLCFGVLLVGGDTMWESSLGSQIVSMAPTSHETPDFWAEGFLCLPSPACFSLLSHSFGFLV